MFRSANPQSLTGLLKYLPKNMALLVQKLSRKKMSKSVSGFFKMKKKFLMQLSLGGGVTALVAWQLKNIFLVLRLP